MIDKEPRDNICGKAVLMGRTYVACSIIAYRQYSMFQTKHKYKNVGIRYYTCTILYYSLVLVNENYISNIVQVYTNYY